MYEDHWFWLYLWGFWQGVKNTIYLNLREDPKAILSKINLGHVVDKISPLLGFANIIFNDVNIIFFLPSNHTAAVTNEQVI